MLSTWGVICGGGVAGALAPKLGVSSQPRSSWIPQVASYNPTLSRIRSISCSLPMAMSKNTAINTNPAAIKLGVVSKDVKSVSLS